MGELLSVVWTELVESNNGDFGCCWRFLFKALEIYEDSLEDWLVSTTELLVRSKLVLTSVAAVSVQIDDTAASRLLMVLLLEEVEIPNELNPCNP